MTDDVTFFSLSASKDAPVLLSTGRRVDGELVFELLVIEQVGASTHLVQFQRIGSGPMTRKTWPLDPTVVNHV